MARADSMAVVVVDELAAVREFYVDTLGCHVADEGPGFAMFRFAGRFMIFVSEPGAMPGLDSARTTHATLALPVPDARAARRVLARKIPDLAPVEEGAFGRRVTLVDPAGTTLWLLEPAAE